MTRSIWKGPFVEPTIMKTFIEASNSTTVLQSFSKSRRAERDGKEVCLQSRILAFQKIWSRGSTIVPQFLGFYVQIYNGKRWIGLQITEEMVGHKFGEFASTRTLAPSGSKKNATSRTKLKAKAR